MTDTSSEKRHETCCYRLRVVDGVTTNMSGAVVAAEKADLEKKLKWLKKFPGKLGVGIMYVEITRVETGESHTFVFVGLGLGAGLSVTESTRGEGVTVCCSMTNCPTFDNFVGWGRMTMASLQAAFGGMIAYFDFGTSGDCRLYFENVMFTTRGLGADIGTYIGYYIKIQ
ncbi:hypothetical protein A3D25_04795 [Candidatus Daviesbacteria bacterium RIFCSPHIGHO2_02_FULL_43_12]|uniref:Uncharacterized protein n=1 Tax=Candidatus Daviesbacteria bacterium RIFCSPHIGHO2_02_FULL_43_12 TaxID=1797776 RepID=A0A1F5KGP1_9BACT|nr:MAG: hypothetical protein A3D25_04795 [Candidatus Daviesbacteria bacterium RIFCSPHIGHO2_02_FULL_43_12]OGE41040.1 MAG: hypothetical protein A3E86_04890 [Candidatus Daviesbacteria bacterium RIFCSPHIGHO2_12_FULL_47_45]